MTCECDFPFHHGRAGCNMPTSMACDECGKLVCGPCNATRYDKELAGMTLCHRCYRRIRDS